jgi:23S rRNA pseudouridine1911/1915/1917 synthase
MPPEGPDQRHAPVEAGRHVVTADRGDDGVRLDLVLLRHLRGPLTVSRTRLQDTIEAGRVHVNGVVVTKTAARVVAGDRIEAELPAVAPREPPRPQPLALDVLFEDEHLLAVNKPPGMVVHPAYKHHDATLFNAVLWHLGPGRAEVRGRAGQISHASPRLLHRLDKDTSGVVLVSKTRTVHAAVVRAMRTGAVRKEYLAIVCGVPRPASGAIALRLARDPADVRRMAVRESEGKQSVTRYQTVSVSAMRAAPGAQVSLVRCELVTGRMHQIRVHLAARGWPVVGDRTYATALKTGGPTCQRQALHAWRVSLPHPVTGAQLVIVAPIPDDMRELMEAARLRLRESA